MNLSAFKIEGAELVRILQRALASLSRNDTFKEEPPSSIVRTFRNLHGHLDSFLLSYLPTEETEFGKLQGGDEFLVEGKYCIAVGGLEPGQAQIAVILRGAYKGNILPIMSTSRVKKILRPE